MSSKNEDGRSSPTQEQLTKRAEPANIEENLGKLFLCLT